MVTVQARERGGGEESLIDYHIGSEFM